MCLRLFWASLLWPLISLTFGLSFLVLSLFSRSSSFYPSFRAVLSTDAHKDNDEEEEKKHSKDDGEEKEGKKKKKGDASKSNEAEDANPLHDAYLRVSVLETPEERGFAFKVTLELCLHECILFLRKVLCLLQGDAFYLQFCSVGYSWSFSSRVWLAHTGLALLALM